MAATSVFPNDVDALRGDDILLSILVLAARISGNSELSLPVDELQGLIREFRGGAEGVILRCFVFSDSGPVPFSPTLEESIGRLSLGGLVSRYDTQNPEILRINPAGEEYFQKEIQPHLNESDRKKLRFLGCELLRFSEAQEKDPEDNLSL